MDADAAGADGGAAVAGAPGFPFFFLFLTQKALKKSAEEGIMGPFLQLLQAALEPDGDRFSLRHVNIGDGGIVANQFFYIHFNPPLPESMTLRPVK